MNQYTVKPLVVSLAVGSVLFSAKIAAQNADARDVGEILVNMTRESGDMQNVFDKTKPINSAASRQINGEIYNTNIHSRATPPRHDSGADMNSLNTKTMNSRTWPQEMQTDEAGSGNSVKINDGGTFVTTPSTDAVLNMATAPLNVMSRELDALRSYRQMLSVAGDEDRHIWGHYLGGYSRVNADNGAAFSMQQHGMGIGADRRKRLESADWIVGGYIAFSDNHVEHARGGKSKITSASGGLYTSWLQDSGFYLDATVKTHRFKNQLSATMDNGQRTSGQWLRNGYTLDGEAGWRLLQSQPVNITPYVRGTRFQVRNGDVLLTTGMTAQTGRSLASKLEAGTRVGTQWQVSTWSVKPYAHMAMVQEFAKGNKVVINEQHHITNNTDGSSARYGAGTLMELSAHTQVYAEAAYQRGRYIESPVEGTAGFRIAF